jgi:DNA adenine methylase
VERARRFFVVSWQGIRGNHTKRPAWRFVKSGSNFAKVPSETWVFDHLYAASARLRRVQFEHRDALEVIRDYDGKGTLFYLDPPYLASTRSTWGSQYEVDEATDEWHRGLLEVALTAKGMVLISAYPSALYEEVLGGAGWTRATTLAQGNAMRRGAKEEVLWISPRAGERLGRLF